MKIPDVLIKTNFVLMVELCSKLRHFKNFIRNIISRKNVSNYFICNFFFCLNTILSRVAKKMLPRVFDNKVS